MSKRCHLGENKRQVWGTGTGSQKRELDLEVEGEKMLTSRNFMFTTIGTIVNMKFFYFLFKLH